MNAQKLATCGGLRAGVNRKIHLSACDVGKRNVPADLDKIETIFQQAEIFDFVFNLGAVHTLARKPVSIKNADHVGGILTKTKAFSFDAVETENLGSASGLVSLAMQGAIRFVYAAENALGNGVSVHAGTIKSAAFPRQEKISEIYSVSAKLGQPKSIFLAVSSRL